LWCSIDLGVSTTRGLENGRATFYVCACVRVCLCA